MDALAADPGVTAVGEIGLDFYRNLSPPDDQREALARQLDLAARVRKPVVVHDREAHVEVTDALVAHAPRGAAVPGILHAFSGDTAMAAALVRAGYLISFALPVSFPKNTGPRDASAEIPDTNLLVETDSPYLGPSKDARNEPPTVLRTAAVIAQLRGEPTEVVGVTTRSAYQRMRGIGATSR